MTTRQSDDTNANPITRPDNFEPRTGAETLKNMFVGLVVGLGAVAVIAIGTYGLSWSVPMPWSTCSEWSFESLTAGLRWRHHATRVSYCPIEPCGYAEKVFPSGSMLLTPGAI